MASVLKAILAAFCLFSVVTKRADAQEFPLEAKIDSLVQPYLESKKFNSVVVGVLYKGEPWVKGYGPLSKDDQAVPNGDTIYEIGSISKVFTGVLLADSILQGKLKPDQSIGTLMDGLEEKNPSIAKITLQQLSQHMSKLPRMPLNLSPSDPSNPYADYDRKKLFEFMEVVSASAPERQYSNLAVGLLGTLVTDRSNTTYEALLTERILNPLGMNDTSVVVPAEKMMRFAPPHNTAGNESYRWDFDCFAGAGGIRSTMNDMLKFAKANLEPPAGELADALKLAWKQQLDPVAGQRGMGLGWFVAGDGSTRFHNGQTGGYHSMMLVNQESKMASILISNTATMDVDPLAEQILGVLNGGPAKPRKFRESKNARKEIQVKPDVMARLVGKYQMVPGIVMTIEKKGDGLTTQLTGQPALPIFAESETKWFLKVVEAELEFELPDDKPATRVTLFQNGREVQCKRMDP